MDDFYNNAVNLHFYNLIKFPFQWDKGVIKMKDGQYGKVKPYAVIDPEKFINLLDNFIDRSEQWAKDAEDRDDWNDVSYYEGQKDVIEELKFMIGNFK